MSLEVASLIIAIIIGFLPLFIKVNGEKLPVSLRGLGVVVAAVLLFIVCSAKFGFPFDWRDQSSLTASDEGDDSAAVDNRPNEAPSQTFSPDGPEQSDDPESEPESEPSDEPIVIGKPFVESPSDASYSGTSLANWDKENDRDIVGRSSY